MVVLIDNVKYACASCIRGHRVKKCNHTDRELVPLSKRGRQISQCTHCRDLRQSHGSHIKCTCAISNAPNPINGCLCEVLLICSCVASHLQNMNDSAIDFPQPDHCNSTSTGPKPQTSCGKETIKTLESHELFQFLHDDIDHLLSL